MDDFKGLSGVLVAVINLINKLIDMKKAPRGNAEPDKES
jgi:hypothetical protein